MMPYPKNVKRGDIDAWLASMGATRDDVRQVITDIAAEMNANGGNVTIVRDL